MKLRSLLLVHGAGSGPWVYDGWRFLSSEFHIAAVDLQRDVDVAHASMTNYADAVVAAGRLLPVPLAICGWSMGGLVAMIAADRLAPEALVLLEPSPPAETQGSNTDVSLTNGTFDPEAVYGPFPKGIRSRPESLLARSERGRGISVPSLPPSTLVVFGDEFVLERGCAISDHYGVKALHVPGATHWDLVLDYRVPLIIGTFLRNGTPPFDAE